MQVKLNSWSLVYFRIKLEISNAGCSASLSDKLRIRLLHAPCLLMEVCLLLSCASDWHSTALFFIELLAVIHGNNARSKYNYWHGNWARPYIRIDFGKPKIAVRIIYRVSEGV